MLGTYAGSKYTATAAQWRPLAMNREMQRGFAGSLRASASRHRSVFMLTSAVVSSYFAVLLALGAWSMLAISALGLLSLFPLSDVNPLQELSLLAKGLVVRLKQPWNVALSDDHIVLTDGSSRIVLAIASIAESRYPFFDSLDELSSLCGCLEIRTSSGELVPIPDNTIGFDEVFWTLERRGKIERVPIS